MSLRLEAGPSVKIRCNGGYHFKVVKFLGKMYAAVPCSHKWCKKGGGSVTHVVALDTGELINLDIYEDVAYPREILGQERNKDTTVE